MSNVAFAKDGLPVACPASASPSVVVSSTDDSAANAADAGTGPADLSSSFSVTLINEDLEALSGGTFGEWV